MLQSIKEVGIEKGIEIGLEKGRILTQRKIAKSLLQTRKFTQKEIVAITGLKPAEIRKIAKALRSG
ncbi:MAG: hypothetical protein DRI57_27035 [Deltaproteobacteria bacterium]|nr:MAG: hypothetical protein DRI57_27035 [Deltaproteobacteria bacterium]